MTIHDSARLLALQRTKLLDTAPEEAFDRLTNLARRVLRVPVSLISLVDRERQFFKSVVGPEPWASLHQTPLSHSFCQHLVPTSKPLIIADARCHPLVNDNLAITELGVVAYLGIPLTSPDGQTLGSLCAIDMQPRQWTEEEIEILHELAASATTEVELRLTTAQLQESYQELKTVHQKLQAVEALRDDLTDMIVHDLRTPLTALLNGLQLMERAGAVNDKQQDILRISRSSANTLLGMVNDLLDISRMEMGALHLEYQELSPALLSDKAMQQVQALATARGLTLTLDVAPGLPTFGGDEDKLLRTLVNLLSNAIKFTAGGGAIIMSVQLTKDEQDIVFSVSDTGEGIPHDALERIFEKFGQVETRKSGHAMSSGLGLTFCKMVVEAHGGCIWVESEVHKGSTFLFRIPIKAMT